jgi:hypothetical protein
MRIYLAALTVILGLAFIIARHDEYATLKGSQETASPNKAAPAVEPNQNHPQENPKYSYWDSPSGHIFHNAFRWPEGTTVWAIILTLLAIAEQTGHTRKAAEATQVSAKATQQQASFMKEQSDLMVSKERAKLRFELDAFDLESSKAIIGHHIKGTVSIFGSTEALIEKTVFFAGILSEGDGEIGILPAPMAEVPNVIRPGSDPLKTWTILFRTNPMHLWVPTVDEGIEDVLSGKSLIFCKGSIHYTDVFNGKWAFRFNRRYKVYLLPDGQRTGGYWEDYGEPEDNGDYKAN